MPTFIDGRAIPIGRKNLAVTRRFYSNRMGAWFVEASAVPTIWAK